MLVKLTEAALSLEERLRASPLHKIQAYYNIGASKPDPTLANFLFRKRHHMEKARQLEIAHAAGLISIEQFCDAFPDVLFVAVNVHYSIAGFSTADTFTTSDVTLVKPELGEFIEELNIELCEGAKVTYVADDKKLRSDVVVGVSIARTGTVADVYKTDYQPPFSFRLGTGVLEVFERMETYVRTNSRRT
ncbi:MAG: hypothetical protein AABX60_01525 [Nanoarchaeota archaeon]